MPEQLTLADATSFQWPAPQVIRTLSGWQFELRCELVQTEERLHAMRDVLVRCEDIVYDSETSGLSPRLGARICGHGLAAVTEPNVVSAWYTPVRHIGGENEAQAQLTPELVAPTMREILAVSGRCGFHHAKFDVAQLRADEIPVGRTVEDTSIDAVIDNENEPSFALKVLADKYCYKGARSEEKALQDWMRADARRLGIPYRKRRRGDNTVEDVLQEPTYLERFGYARTPLQLCGVYACKDVAYTLYLWLVKFAHVAKLYAPLHKREHRISQILHKMEWAGLPMNEALVRDAHDRSAAEVTHWLGECRRLSGLPGFEGTDNELRRLFYERLRLPVMRRTSGGKGKKTEGKPSVDKVARKLLAKAYPEHAGLIDATIHLARARKIHSTYTGSFLRFLSQEGRVHPSYNQLEQRDSGGVPVTGRLSSAEPNIQNVDNKPMHLHKCLCPECIAEKVGAVQGKPDIIHIREFFTVPEGFIRFYLDFSQIELCTLTWLCQDPTLLRAYREGLDVHQIIADELDIKRAIAKQVNFGNSFGMTKVGLALRLPGYYDDPEGTEAYAEQVLERYFARYSRILAFRNKFATDMRRSGCKFESPFNRWRRIPTINSHKQWERSRAERMMMSSIVSGMAADVMKEAMIRCDDILVERDDGSEMVQTIHDELVFDTPAKPGWAALLVKLVRTMEHCPLMTDPPDGREGVKVRVSAEVTRTTWKDKREVQILDDDTMRWAA
jgi:DNA polymerase-1